MRTYRQPALLVLTLMLAGLIGLAAGCTRTEVRRKSYPGFSVDSGAAAPPTARTYEVKPPKRDRGFDPLGDMWRGMTGLFKDESN